MPGTRPLRAVPDTPPRALGLVRVSRERDGMISPEVQRVAISDYCTAHGYQLLDVREGLDQSGSRARSAWWPTLDRSVADVEAGQYDVIVVWKYSRVARHRLRWAVAVDRVEEAGGRIESATEQVDTTTSTGRFTRGMLAELQAFEAERIGEVWRSVHEARVRAGRPANGKPRWGYLYDLKQQLHVPDPDSGPVLADLYRRYVAGESVYQLVRWLNGHGWRTTTGGPWSDRSLRRVLDSGFASGRFMVAGELQPGVHEPLVEAGLWQAYLDARGARRGLPARVVRSQYLLSGLVRCARCGKPMVAGQFGEGRKPKYRCSTSKEQGAGECRGGYVMESFVLGHVMDYLRGVAAGVEATRSGLEPLMSHRAVIAVEEDVLARKILRADEALTRLAVQDAQSPLPEQVYQRARSELLEEKASLERALEAARRESRRAVDDRPAVARGLLEDWEDRPVSVRREILRGLVDCVLVTTGRPYARFRIVEPSEVRPPSR